MIDFSGYTKESIQKEMLKQVDKGIDTREGSMVQTAIGPVAWYLEGLYMLLSQVQQNAYAGSAVGEFLDLICACRGVTRKPAISAIRKGTFNVPVPAGSVFRTINGVNSVLFTVGDLIEKTDDSYTYKMTCETSGIIGNTYVGNLLAITAINGLTSAVIGETIISGNEEEKDESLRSRYFATFDVAAFGGNIVAYRTEILAMAGVGAVQVYPAWRGGGTVLCSVLNSELMPADTELIDQIQNVICPAEEGGTSPSSNGYGMAPIGAAVTITTAKIRWLNISVTIQFAEGIASGAETYRTQIEKNIQDYLNSVKQTWGSPIKGQKIEYNVAIYISRIVMAILTVPAVVNVTNVIINGGSEDITLTETAEEQEIPELGEVIINGS